MFKNRTDAGLKISRILDIYKNDKNTIVVGLPRGGVVPAYVVAKELNLPLDVVMVKKIGHPSNPEYAIGATSLTGTIVNKDAGVSDDYIYKETARIKELLKKRYELYSDNRQPPNFEGKIVIVTDDGIATGKTMIAALQLIKNDNPVKIIVAIPVGPEDTVNEMKKYADIVVCLETHDDFTAISPYYEEFNQVSDEEVQNLLKTFGNTKYLNKSWN